RLLDPSPDPHSIPPHLIVDNGSTLLAIDGKESAIVGLTGITFRRGGTAPDIAAWKAPAVDERIALVKEAAGQRFMEIELNALVQRVIVTDDRRPVAEDLARERWGELSADDLLASPHAPTGTLAAPVEARD